jgi:glycosyltransferase involved in cell wall biosynthesis
MKLGISIATYYRKNGKTRELLTRCLNSIKNQIHQDYIVFLIGDKYDNTDEFVEIATSIIPSEKIIYENLDYALERDKYLGIDMMALWSSGGVNARNYANDLAKNYVEYCCQLDDDDYFFENHLASIQEVIDKKSDAVFIHTLSTYGSNPAFPIIEANDSIIERYPEPQNLIHSSVCMHMSKLDGIDRGFKYRDVFADEGVRWPADADMWGRIKYYCEHNNLKSYCISRVTCSHETEQSILRQ